MLGELDPGDLAVQLLAQDLRRVDDTDAVRQHECCVVDDPHIDAVPAAQVDDFRIGRYHIALLPRTQAAHREADCLLHRHGMEMHTQNRSGFHACISYGSHIITKR